MQEMLKQYGQGIMVAAEKAKGMGKAERRAVKNLARLSKTGDEEEEEEGGCIMHRVLEIGGFPGISVPAAYDARGVPLG